MLSAVEIARGVHGALRFLQRDPAAPYLFENSFEACARSFRLMALVAPLWAFDLAMQYSRYQTDAALWEVALLEALQYLFNWLFFPVVMWEIARRTGHVGVWPRYITALNWITLPSMVVLVMAGAVAQVAPAVVTTIVLFSVQGLFFYWFLTITVSVLGVGWGFAGGLLLINWLPLVMLSLAVRRILGLVPAIGG